MPKPRKVSIERILALKQKGVPIKDIAWKFKVKEITIYKAIERARYCKVCGTLILPR